MGKNLVVVGGLLWFLLVMHHFYLNPLNVRNYLQRLLDAVGICPPSNAMLFYKRVHIIKIVAMAWLMIGVLTFSLTSGNKDIDYWLPTVILLFPIIILAGWFEKNKKE